MDRKQPTQRQRQKEQTRRLLLDTAMEQFAKTGFLSTRAADIAKAAHVSHGTVFAHFATQEVLLTAVIEEFGSRLTSRLHELAVESSTVDEVLSAHLQGVAEHEAFYTRLVIENRMLPQVARTTLMGIQSVISYHLGQVALKEMEQQKLKPIAPYLLFNTWIGLVHYYLVNHDWFAPGASVIQSRQEELLCHFRQLLSV
jgi:AcrR family transcriptional regulator